MFVVIGFIIGVIVVGCICYYDVKKGNRVGRLSWVTSTIWLAIVAGFTFAPVMIPIHFETPKMATLYYQSQSFQEMYINQTENVVAVYGSAEVSFYGKGERGWRKFPSREVSRAHFVWLPHAVSIYYVTPEWAYIEVTPEHTFTKNVLPTVSDSMNTNFVLNEQQKTIAFVKEMPANYTLTINQQIFQISNLKKIPLTTPLMNYAQWCSYWFFVIFLAALPIVSVTVVVKKISSKQKKPPHENAPPSDQEQ